MAITNPYTQIGSKLKENQWLTVPLQGMASAFVYIVTLRFLVLVALWIERIFTNVKQAVFAVMLAASKASESLFIIATFYVVCNFFAHSLVSWLLGDQTIGVCNQVALVVFSALPELIVLDALKTSWERYQFARQSGKVEDWIWASATIIPSVIFAGMMIYAMTSFGDLESTGQAVGQVTGLALIMRIVTGWIYSFVNGLYDRIGKRNYTNFVDQLQQTITEKDNTITKLTSQVAQLQQDMATLQEQMAEQGRTLFEAQMALATRRMGRTPSQMHLTPKKEQMANHTTHLTHKPSVQNSHLTSNTEVNIGEQMSKQSPDLPVNNDASTSVQDSHLTVDTQVNIGEQENDLSSNTEVNIGEQSSVQDSHLTPDTEVISSVHESEHSPYTASHLSVLTNYQSPDTQANKNVRKSVHKTKAESSEAAKKIQRILRKNPNTGPTELAAKTGVSRGYASQIKSEFLKTLRAEQSA